MLAAMVLGLGIAIALESWVPLIASFVVMGLLYLAIRAANKNAGST